MAEFFKKNQEEAEKTNEWLNQFKPNFESAVERIEKHQERKLFNLEIISLAFAGAFLINLLTNALFDLLSANFQRVIFDAFVVALTISLLAGIFLYFRSWLLRYQPKKPVLTLWVKPEDIKPFSSENEYKAIMDFLYEGKLKNFKQFGDSLFGSLGTMFPHMFGADCNAKPIKEFEQEIDTDYETHKEFVIMQKDYDLSHFISKGVKFSLSVSLVPLPVYEFVNREGGEYDQSAIYSFYLAYNFTIENPEHYHAREALERYYLFYASSIITFSKFAIFSAFKKAGAFKELDKAFLDKLKSH